jgi:hypothetical protein
VRLVVRDAAARCAVRVCHAPVGCMSQHQRKSEVFRGGTRSHTKLRRLGTNPAFGCSAHSEAGGTRVTRRACGPVAAEWVTPYPAHESARNPSESDWGPYWLLPSTHPVVWPPAGGTAKGCDFKGAGANFEGATTASSARGPSDLPRACWMAPPCPPRAKLVAGRAWPIIFASCQSTLGLCPC